MITIENVEVSGWKASIRGMRNPLNSWGRSDSTDRLGENDLRLMRSLAQAGTDHRKFMRFLVVTMDVTAPLYWWKEFDTYKVGTVANSCSTMHTVADRPFTLDDFSHEQLTRASMQAMSALIDVLNYNRDHYKATNEKEYWWQIIQLLPSSYNQRRTVLLNYEVLASIYHARKDHKLDEWRVLCRWIVDLPYSELITGGGE